MITQDDLDLAKKAQDATRKIISEFRCWLEATRNLCYWKIGEFPMLKLD